MELQAHARPAASTVAARTAGLPAVPDPQAGVHLGVLPSDDSDTSEACALCKSEPVYTPNVELLLDGLREPLQVAQTVDPRDAEQCIEKWMPSIHKEIGVIEKAVWRLRK